MNIEVLKEYIKDIKDNENIVNKVFECIDLNLISFDQGMKILLEIFEDKEELLKTLIKIKLKLNNRDIKEIESLLKGVK